MQEPDTARMVLACQQIARTRFGMTIDSAQIQQIIESVLYGERNLWEAAAQGVVTHEEVARAIAAHVHTFLVRRSGQSWAEQPADVDVTDFLHELEDAAFGQTAKKETF